MITVRIEMSVPKSVRTHHPYVRVAAKDNDVAISNGRYINIVGHRLVGFFDNKSRGRWGRRRWTECCDHCVYLVWIYN
jgi:hypothetical protein